MECIPNIPRRSWEGQRDSLKGERVSRLGQHIRWEWFSPLLLGLTFSVEQWDYVGIGAGDDRGGGCGGVGGDSGEAKALDA